MLSGILDLGIDLDVWPWVWLGIAVLFAVIEFTLLAGSFVLLPFAVSAFLASLLGFYDVAVEIQWFVFIFGGALVWVLLYQRMQRFVGENEIAPGVGAERLIGLTGIVTHDIDPLDTARAGRVNIDGEDWGALTDGETTVPEGAKVKVTAMAGTRVKVVPIASTAENTESS